MEARIVTSLRTQLAARFKAKKVTPIVMSIWIAFECAQLPRMVNDHEVIRANVGLQLQDSKVIPNRKNQSRATAKRKPKADADGVTVVYRRNVHICVVSQSILLFL